MENKISPKIAIYILCIKSNEEKDNVLTTL